VGCSQGAVATLDHSMWFHAPFHADSWLLYQMTSPHAGNGRALCFGQLFRPDTRQLVVSCAQQGVVRLARPSIARTAADVGWRGAHLLGQLKTLVLGRQ
jgi:acyl-CoA thioesterase